MFPKFLKFLLLAPLVLVMTACESDDNDEGPANPEEEINNVILTLTRVGNPEDVQTFDWRDLDGDGGAAPVITNRSLQANASYTFTVQFRLLSPTGVLEENVTEEIEEENDEHGVFFVGSYDETTGNTTALSNLGFSNLDTDANGCAVGLTGTLTTGAGTGAQPLTVVLKHQPGEKDCVPTGGVSDINTGETDVQVSFTATLFNLAAR